MPTTTDWQPMGTVPDYGQTVRLRTLQYIDGVWVHDEVLAACHGYDAGHDYEWFTPEGERFFPYADGWAPA